MKFFTYLIIGVIVLLSILGYFLIFNKDKTEKEIVYYKDLPESNISISVNGQEQEIETVCNSQLIKCTKNGCEEVCES